MADTTITKVGSSQSPTEATSAPETVTPGR
jgi:hypothetical protein